MNQVHKQINIMHIYPLSCYLIYAVDFTGNLGSAPSISNQVYG